MGFGHGSAPGQKQTPTVERRPRPQMLLSQQTPFIHAVHARRNYENATYQNFTFQKPVQSQDVPVQPHNFTYINPAGSINVSASLTVPPDIMWYQYQNNFNLHPVYQQPYVPPQNLSDASSQPRICQVQPFHMASFPPGSIPHNDVSSAPQFAMGRGMPVYLLEANYDQQFKVGHMGHPSQPTIVNQNWCALNKLQDGAASIPHNASDVHFQPVDPTSGCTPHFPQCAFRSGVQQNGSFTHQPGVIQNGIYNEPYQSSSSPSPSYSFSNSLSSFTTKPYDQGSLTERQKVPYSPKFSVKASQFACQRFPSAKGESCTVGEVIDNYLKDVYPELGVNSYCVPPIDRSHHPDKSNKQLVLSLESERRVLGSFERFFADQGMPVFMVCNYPVQGFLQQFSQVTKRNINQNKSGIKTVTLLLLSTEFSVTLVTVSTVSGNSDFFFIQRGVYKAASRLKCTSGVVSQWFHYLGMKRTKIRQVIAFPNLKKAMMQRIVKDKSFQKSYGGLSTLHLDDLSAPFEEEWTTPVHKHLFSTWMEATVLCHHDPLPIKDLRLLIGALFCPQLSVVPFLKADSLTNGSPDDGILPEEVPYSTQVLKGSQEIGQLKLTISGVTMGFDEFMDEYVNSYYPDIENKTYRVPPIHFNIQSFKKSENVLKDLEQSRTSQNSLEVQDGKDDDAHSSVSLDTNASDESSLSSLSDRSSVFKPEIPLQVQDTIQGTQAMAGDFMGPVKSYSWDTKTSTSIMDPFVMYEPIRNASVEDIAAIGGEVSGTETADPQPYEMPGTVSQNKVVKKNAKQEQRHASQFDALERKRRLTQRLVGSAPKERVYQNVRAVPKRPFFKSPSNIKHQNDNLSTKTAALKGVDVLTEPMTKDTRADEGENRVISAFEWLARRFGPMFIICGYQYNNYLNKLREEMFPKGETVRPVRAFGQTMRAEHDCLIFHKNYGAIVVCIKAIGDNFTAWGASEEDKRTTTAKILNKAVKQLEREEAMIHHVTSDLQPNLPCHKLIAVPNLARKDVEKALESDPELSKKVDAVTHNLGSKSFLCQEELPAKFFSVWDPPSTDVLEKLISWWKHVEQELLSKEGGVSSMCVYRQIIGRYCGLLSTVEVWTLGTPRMEVRSMSEAVSLCAQRFAKLILLPRQIEAFMLEDKRLFLFGPPGAGKTLLLTLKAREWLLEGHTVVLLNVRCGADGFPVAYGIELRLRRMMEEAGITRDKLVRININSLKFQSEMLAGVLPSCRVIMDEVTPATHATIEHLCCLQLDVIWCAGLFEDDCPITARQFRSFGLNRILRCPPSIQSLLKHIEKNVRTSQPYRNSYKVSNSDKRSSFQLVKEAEFKQDEEFNKENNEVQCQYFNGCSAEKKSGLCSALKEQKNTCHEDLATVKKEKENLNTSDDNLTEEANDASDTEDRKYDIASINKRLQKYNRSHKMEENKHAKEQEFRIYPQLSTDFPKYSSAEIGLATDGPRPHLINHFSHLHARNPMDCAECGTELADYLLSMVSTKDSAFQLQQSALSKNKFAFRSSPSRLRVSLAEPLISVAKNGNDMKKESGSSALNQKLGAFFNSKALTWSDTLIVAMDLDPKSKLISVLKKRGIPVEVVSGPNTHRIEMSLGEKKVFLTSGKEVNGLERPLMVFIPSQDCDSDVLKQTEYPRNTKDSLDLHLGKSVCRYSEADRCVLWYVASRSLSSLVMIVP